MGSCGRQKVRSSSSSSSFRSQLLPWHQAWILSSHRLISLNFYCPANKTYCDPRPQRLSWWTFRHTTWKHRSPAHVQESVWVSGRIARKLADANVGNTIWEVEEMQYTFQNTMCNRHTHHTGLYSIRKILVNKFLLDKAHQQRLYNWSVFFLIVNRPWTLLRA